MKLTKGNMHLTKARKAAFEEALEVRTRGGMKLADQPRINLPTLFEDSIRSATVTQLYRLIN